MPIYEYHCAHCKKDFERFQKISEAPLLVCPDCGEKVQRVVSQTAFTLKGSGWYKDGYSSSPKKSSSEEKPKAKEPKKESRDG